MKLVEILARELSEWPDECEAITQSLADTEIYKTRLNCPSDLVNRVNGSTYLSSRHCEPDRYPVVTREMWEAERARIKLEAEMESVGAKLTTSKITIDVDMSPLKEALACFQDQIEAMSAITNRDRIRAIDVQLANLTAERAERIAELAAEGFALLPVVGVADMSDWRNWHAGDLLEVVDIQDECHSFKVGDVIEMLKHDTNLRLPAPYCKSSNGVYGWVMADKMKFHSRPKPC